MYFFNSNTSCWRGCGGKGTFFHMWWLCPAAQYSMEGMTRIVIIVISDDIPLDLVVCLLNAPVKRVYFVWDEKLISLLLLAARLCITQTQKESQPSPSPHTH